MSYEQEIKFTTTLSEHSVLREAVRKIVDYRYALDLLTSEEYSLIVELYDVINLAKTVKKD